ncbi:MAG: TlpA family protein disulfide reductase [Desulfobacterales bacterium]|nr:TlpA family protein disulfide reductase [Desulfobacterales bacterium]
MRFVKRPLIVLLASAAVVLAAAGSASALMQLGDSAPALEISQWVQGKPADLATGRETAIQLIEFWAPDCPHCRDSVPLLNDLHKTYGSQVAVIGITDAEPAPVRAFLSGTEEPVIYGIALDDAGKTKIAYMEGFGISGVPHAFLVDRRGRVAWQGHPMDGLAEALEQMIVGTYDMEQQALRATADKLLGVYVYLAEQTRESDLLQQVGKRILACARRDAGLLHRLAQEIAFNKSIRNPDLALALRAAEQAFRIDGSDPELAKTREDLLRRLGNQAEGRTEAATNGDRGRNPHQN